MTYGQLRSTKLVSEGRFEEAVARAVEEIAAMPDDPEAHFNRAQALAGLGRWEEAVGAYETALGMDASESGLDPDTLDDELFFALRSLALAQRDDRARAIATLERYRALLPAGRHVGDLATWTDHINGVEAVWVRDR